jgi:hypothetical protein
MSLIQSQALLLDNVTLAHCQTTHLLGKQMGKYTWESIIVAEIEQSTKESVIG